MPARSTNDVRRLGTVLVLGVVAGAGARYLLARAAERASTAGPQPMIDWQQARSIALRVSQWEQAPVNDRNGRRTQYLQMVDQSEPLIADYMGVQLPEPMTRLYVVDRREWLLANFESFKHIFAPIEELYQSVVERQRQNGNVNVLAGLNAKIVGSQMGALLGFLARRVLGQYDLSLLSPDPEAQGVLYFVEPNIARVQTQLGLSDHDFRLWITLHECTHVFQFEAFPWVRSYFNDLLGRFLGTMTDQLSGMNLNVSDLAGRLLGGQGSKHWIERVMSPEQREIFDKMQALMSVVEGYSNHVMNAIGGKLLPSFHQIEQRIQQRQANRTLIEELFNRITGMDLKLAQYQQGEAFINKVVELRGVEFANQVWKGPEYLPTMDEIRNPQQWIDRIG